MKVAVTECIWDMQGQVAARCPLAGLPFRAPPGLGLEASSRRSSVSSASDLGIRPPPGLEELQEVDICEAPSWASGGTPSEDSASDSDGDHRAMREWRTTLHVRNLPCYFTRASFVQLIDAQGLAGHYDFVYLPMDFQTRQSIGYAFVNFRTSVAALLFRAAMDGFSRWPVRSRKVCSVQWSQTQGLERNVRLVRNNGLMKKAGIPEEFKPTVFVDGQSAPFPSAPRKLRPEPKHLQL